MSINFRNKLHNRNIWAVLVFVMALGALNIAFISTVGWAKLVWTLAGYASLLIAYRAANLNLNSIGLSKKGIKPGLKLAAYIIGGILLAMLLLFLIDKTLFHDARYHQSFLSALYSTLILLPLKTVFFEELTFRGILPALLLKIKNQRRFATILSSLAFGLWHITSATKIGNHSLIGGVTIPNIVVVTVVVLATSVAGYIFCELRWRSNSLVAPIAVHWFLNGFGTILASLSWL